MFKSILTYGVIVAVVLFFVLAQSDISYIPQRISQETVGDITGVTNPETKHMFFGELQSFPHTFEIKSDTSFQLYVEIRVPDIESAKNNISGIIIKEKDRGGVEEVARLHAKTATWTRMYEKFEGGYYRSGPYFDGQLEPGIYRVEVSTPDNLEKYVLIMGTGNSTESLGYFEKIAKIAETKVFFEKSQFFIIKSRVVYRPIIFLVLVFVLFSYLKRRRKQ